MRKREVCAPLALILLGPLTAGFSQPDVEFMCGINTWGTRTGPIHHIKALGAKWHAPFLNWNHVQPTIPPSRVALTVEDVKADTAMIDSYIADLNWARFDRVINALKTNGFKIFPVIGQCFTSTVPKVDGKPIIPHNPDETLTFFDNPFGKQVCPIARDHYLGHLYLHVRAVVRRYRDVNHWMVDPETNQSCLLRVFGGWKAGNAWADWDFVTGSVQTLSQAIRDEDPSDLVCLPFNTDQPPAVTLTYARGAWLSGGQVTVLDWPDAITAWLPHIDMVGIDVFEGQGTADCNCYRRLHDKIRTAVQRAKGKPVAVTSLGCPSGPAALGWTEENQATYVSQAFDAAVRAGARGFFYFEVRTGEKHRVSIDASDVRIMQRARTVYNNAWGQTEVEFAATLAELVLWLTNELGGYQQMVDYLRDHFFKVLETAEAYWGLVGKDNTLKPAFHALRARYTFGRGAVAEPPEAATVRD